MSTTPSSSDLKTISSDNSTSDTDFTLPNSDSDCLPPPRPTTKKRTLGTPTSVTKIKDKERFESDWATDHEKSIETNKARILNLTRQRGQLDRACNWHELGMKEDNEVIERLTQTVKNYQNRIALRTRKVQSERKRQKIRLGEKHSVAQEICTLQTRNIVLNAVRAKGRLELQRKARKVDAVLYHIAPAASDAKRNTFDDPEWSRLTPGMFAVPDWAKYAHV